MPNARDYTTVLARIADALEHPPITVTIYRTVTPDQVEPMRRALQLQAPTQRVTVLFASIKEDVVDTQPLPFVGIA
jgi:hypothetical protein